MPNDDTSSPKSPDLHEFFARDPVAADNEAYRRGSGRRAKVAGRILRAERARGRAWSCSTGLMRRGR